MIGQAFALAHGERLISAMWCETLPASPQGGRDIWDQRIKTVRGADSLAPLADPTVERWLTDDFKAKHAGRWKQIRDTVIGTTPAGYLGCCAAILDFDFTPRLPEVRVPTLVVCGAEDAGTPPDQNRKLAGLYRAKARRRLVCPGEPNPGGRAVAPIYWAKAPLVVSARRGTHSRVARVPLSLPLSGRVCAARATPS